MNSATAEKKAALSIPAIRTNVLAEVQAGLWITYADRRFSRARMEMLDAQLHSPPMFLYEDGSCEIVVPAIGPDRGVEMEWEDLTVWLVSTQGARISAGRVVWSTLASAA